MKKHIKSFVIVALLIGLFIFPLAQTSMATNQKVQWLIDQGMVQGRNNNGVIDYALDEPIMRAEVSKMLVNYAGYGAQVSALAKQKSPFKDIETTFWANGYINVAYQKGMIRGYPTGHFRPNAPVSYAELAAMLVRLDARWTDINEQSAQWPSSYMTSAAEYGILKDVYVPSDNAEATRSNAFSMIYNAIHSQGLRVTIELDYQDPDILDVTRHEIGMGSSLGALYPVTPTRAGYTFAGWNTSPDGDGQWINRDTPFNNNTRIYGIWEENGVVIHSIKQIEPMRVTPGTPASELSLPEFITVYLSNNRTMIVPVEWDRSSFKPNQFGRQDLTGDYEVPKQVTGGQKPIPTLPLIVTH